MKKKKLAYEWAKKAKIINLLRLNMREYLLLT